MTVSAKVPIIEYQGNGLITSFAWDWDMIEDSFINVKVDNFNIPGSGNWSEQGQTVVFVDPPADGAFIQIYRRTIIWQPEDYVAFGRFHSEKTELSMDRATLIAQERGGGRGLFNAPTGIVGAYDLSVTRGEFDTTVVSERGTDAVLPIYIPDDTTTPAPTPDPSIIWAGDDIEGVEFSLPGNTSGISTKIAFRMDLSEGILTEASAIYTYLNAFTSASWLNVDPNDNEYWMRVTQVGTQSKAELRNGEGQAIAWGAAFKMAGKATSPTQGPYVSVDTFGDVAPATRVGNFVIEICKDSGGLPDGGWVSRNVRLEAIFNA